MNGSLDETEPLIALEEAIVTESPNILDECEKWWASRDKPKQASYEKADRSWPFSIYLIYEKIRVYWNIQVSPTEVQC